MTKPKFNLAIPKVLACQGGGAKGAWQAGVTYALMTKGVSFNAFFGTSVGALNSALAFTNQIAALKDIWENMSRKKVWKFSFMNMIRIRSFASNKPLMNLINTYLTSEKLELAKANGKFLYHWVTNFNKNCSQFIMYGKSERDEPYRDFLLASASIPVFFPSVKINGANYVDGGLKMNNPVYLTNTLGLNEIINIAPIQDNNSSRNILFKVFSNLLDEQVRSHLAIFKHELAEWNNSGTISSTVTPKCAYLILPTEKLRCDLFSFNKNKCYSDFQLGIRDGEAFLKDPGADKYDVMNFNTDPTL